MGIWPAIFPMLGLGAYYFLQSHPRLVRTMCCTGMSPRGSWVPVLFYRLEYSNGKKLFMVAPAGHAWMRRDRDGRIGLIQNTEQGFEWVVDEGGAVKFRGVAATGAVARAAVEERL